MNKRFPNAVLWDQTGRFTGVGWVEMLVSLLIPLNLTKPSLKLQSWTWVHLSRLNPIVQDLVAAQSVTFPTNTSLHRIVGDVAFPVSAARVSGTDCRHMSNRRFRYTSSNGIWIQSSSGFSWSFPTAASKKLNYCHRCVCVTRR